MTTPPTKGFKTQLFTVIQYYGDGDGLSPSIVGDSDYGAFADGRMLQKRFFDFQSGELITATLDDIYR